LLAAVTLAVYWPVGHYEFVDYDDRVYVVENAHVAAGLTRAGMAWAFTRLTGDGTYWHPVTWLSHMLDCQIFGLKPGPPHLVNLGFHIANALMLFLLLRRMTGAVWRSAAVAALFSLHPWQVETVAWVAERKNVLSTFFLLLTLWAYARYVEVQSLKSKVQSPKSEVQSRRAERRGQKPEASNTLHAPRFTLHAFFYYVLALVLFALGLMSKPMLVTLPFVLLLLDYWPLGRSAEWGVRSAESGTGQGNSLATGWGKLWLEKLPFFAMSGAVIWVTMAGHHRFGMAATSPPISLAARLANGLVSYGRYIAGTFWPTDMAGLYPFREQWPVGLVAGAGVLLAGVSAWAIWRLRQRPYFAVGWFWFLGTLVPVIGLVQDGAQAMADRYMYVPLIGLLMVLCWGTAEIVGRLSKSSAGVTPAGSGGVPPPAQPGLRGGTPPLTLRRDACATWVAPIAAIALMGCAWATCHELQFWQNSVALFGRAVAVTQNNYLAEEDLGVALGKSGAVAEARAHLAEALRIKPNNPSAHFNLGYWLTLEGNSAEAAAHYREALRLRPSYPKALNNLAWLLATHPDPRQRNGAEAMQLARRAADLTGGTDPGDLDTLAAACAEAHQFGEAIKVAQRAAALAQSAGQHELARQIQMRLTGYRSDKPYHEP
jgi:Flp pilus assembly protein TadD